MLWAFVLTLLGVTLALVPVGAGWPDIPDLIVFLLMVAGVVWGWRKAQGRLRVAGAVFLTFLLGMHAYWVFLFAPYPEASGVPDEGSRPPDITATRVRDGARFHLGAQRGHQTVLVFFRGEW